MLDAQMWSILADAATAVSALVVIIAATVAVWQLRESARARILTAMLSVYSSIGDASARADRRRVYQRDTSLDLAAWDSELYEAAERTVLMFNRFGALAKHHLLSRRVFLRTHANLVIRCHFELEDFISYRRMRTGSTFGRDFEWLANLARNWRLTQPDRIFPLVLYSPDLSVIRVVDASPRQRSRNPVTRALQWLASLRYRTPPEMSTEKRGAGSPVL